MSESNDKGAEHERRAREAVRKFYMRMDGSYEECGFPEGSPMGDLLNDVCKLAKDAHAAGRREAIAEVVPPLEFQIMFIEHAQALGYLGEGSTLGMSNDALAKSKALLAKLNAEGEK